MPKARIRPRQIANRQALEAALLAEWSNPSDDPNAPIIVEEQVDPTPWPLTRIYVIWDAWADLSTDDRADIVDAVLQNLKPDREETAAMTVAFGLTSEEAARMGISYEMI